MNRNEMPKEIQNKIKGKSYELDDIGMSDSSVLCFEDVVLKIEVVGEEAENQEKMMQWLDGKLAVPKVLYSVQEKDKNYLLMTKITGEMLCEEKYMTQPKELVRLLAEGLKLLWEVKIEGCPCNNSLEHTLQRAEIRVKNGTLDTDVESDTYGEDGFESPEALLQWLKEHKPEEDFVFSHGDYCLPNVFAKDGKVTGFIDIGNSGIADRYQDIALCYRSLQHNFSGRFNGKAYPGFEPNMLFDELGIDPDWEKIRYYILLDELF